MCRNHVKCPKTKSSNIVMHFQKLIQFNSFFYLSYRVLFSKYIQYILVLARTISKPTFE